MIYLREPHILFVRARKIAGTSLSLALSMYADDTSVVVPMFVQYEMMRLAMGGKTPVNWSPFKNVEQQYDELLHTVYDYCVEKGYNPLEWDGGYFDDHVQEVLQFMLKNDKHKIMQPGGRPKGNYMLYVGHLPAGRMRQMFAHRFVQAHKVTIVRHPYEEFLSLAYQFRERNKRQNREAPLNDSIWEAINGGPFNAPYYFLDKKPCCDTYLRLETLDDDIDQFGQKMGIDITSHMLHTRSRIRDDKTPATEVLSDEQKAIIYDICRPQFDEFGYKP